MPPVHPPHQCFAAHHRKCRPGCAWRPGTFFCAPSPGRRRAFSTCCRRTRRHVCTYPVCVNANLAVNPFSAWKITAWNLAGHLPLGAPKGIPQKNSHCQHPVLNQLRTRFPTPTPRPHATNEQALPTSRLRSLPKWNCIKNLVI